MDEGGLLVAKSERGLCKVLNFSPRHDMTLPRMAVADIEKVIAVWVEQYREMGELPYINYVQIFENRGAMMGNSNPHPHCQIWSSEIVPDIPAKEQKRQKSWLKEKHSCLLCDYLALELKKQERIVLENDSFAALVPFWAVWPFETMILPKRHMTGIDEMNEAERKDLADIMKRMGIRFDNLFLTSFQYSMGIHQRPTDGKAHPEWHFHSHYMPPLLRSATVRKFMVGFELLGMPQRDITAESAAERLRQASPVHYLEG
jgi:UDPglucose--hexose-1-phosphate uridylyltransferase